MWQEKKLCNFLLLTYTWKFLLCNQDKKETVGDDEQIVYLITKWLLLFFVAANLDEKRRNVRSLISCTLSPVQYRMNYVRKEYLFCRTTESLLLKFNESFIFIWNLNKIIKERDWKNDGTNSSKKNKIFLKYLIICASKDRLKTQKKTLESDKTHFIICSY